MKKQTLLKLFIVGICVCISTAASANGLLGKHNLGASVVSQNWGDSTMDSLLGRSTGGEIAGSYSLSENWNITASYRGLWDSYDTVITTNAVSVDVEVHRAMAGLNYVFANSSPITPYVGGEVGALVYKDGSSSESDTAYNMELGVEWDMCEDAFINLAAYYDYIDNNTPDNDDYGAILTAGVQVIEKLMLVGSLSYSPEEYNSTATIGLVVHQ